MKTIILTCFALSVCLCSLVYAGPLKEEYELQERCGRRSAEVFKDNYGNGIGNGTIAHYVCHYNKAVNKCFMVIVFNAIPKKDRNQEDIPGYTEKDLLDVNGNQHYEQYIMFSNNDTPMECEVSGAKCSSAKEWDKMVKPYMEK